MPCARNPARPEKQQQPGVLQSNCPLFYCDYLFTFYTCCGCPPVLPGCLFLCVSPPLPLMDSCFSRSLNHGLSPSFTSPDRQAGSSLHLRITGSSHQCWISISSWCQVSAQPTALASRAGKPSSAPDFVKGCLQESSSFIHSVLYVPFLLRIFCLMWQETAVCVGGSLFLELNPCLFSKQIFSYSSGTEIPWSQENFSKEHFFCQTLFSYP